QHETRQSHLKNARGKNKQFERCRWGQRGGKHQGQELLALKAVADALQLGFINTFEQEQLTSGPAQVVGQQAAQSRAYSTGDTIKPGAAGVSEHEPRDQGIHGNAEEGGVDTSQKKNAPGAQGLQGSDPGAQFQEDSVLNKQGLHCKGTRGKGGRGGRASRMAMDGNRPTAVCHSLDADTRY